MNYHFFFFFQAEDGIRDLTVTGVQTCALPISTAERAAELCKCDLLTAMVGEFPELQGVMGTYYALADGETAEVAVSIREHYLPRTAGDELPTTATGVAVAIADKLDTLAGISAIAEH